MFAQTRSAALPAGSAASPAGFVGALLLLVELECLAPCGVGLLVLAEGGVGVAEGVEGVGAVVGVAEAAVQGEGLLVVLDGLVVVACVVVDVAEAVEGGGLAIGIVVAPVQGQCALAACAGGLVIAEAGGVPAGLVERNGLQRWLVEGAEKVKGLGGVIQGLPVVALPCPGVGEHVVGAGLVGSVVTVSGQGEGRCRCSIAS